MNTMLKKGNSKALVITPEVRREIREFRDRLIDIRERPDETSHFDVRTIDIIINELDDYDRNMLLAYYSIGEGRPSVLAKYLNITPQAVILRIDKILNKIKKLNDVPKTTYNSVRCCPDD